MKRDHSSLGLLMGYGERILYFFVAQSLTIEQQNISIKGTAKERPRTRRKRKRILWNGRLRRRRNGHAMNTFISRFDNGNKNNLCRRQSYQLQENIGPYRYGTCPRPSLARPCHMVITFSLSFSSHGHIESIQTQSTSATWDPERPAISPYLRYSYLRHTDTPQYSL